MKKTVDQNAIGTSETELKEAIREGVTLIVDGTNFCTICSNEYLPYFYTLACSIRKNVSGQVDIYVITQNISVENEKELLKFGNQSLITFHIIRVNDSYLNRFTYFNANVLGRYPRTLFCVLTLSDLLPDNLERTMFMEVDTIVDGDITDLYNIDFKGNLIAGATWGTPSNQYEPNQKPYAAADNILIETSKVHDHHINTGAVLFNIKGLRELNVCPEYYKPLKNCDNPEQYLGSAFGKKMLFVNPLRFNYRTSWDDTYKRMGLSGKTAIIHYVNRSINAIYKKPWQILFEDNALHYIARGCPNEERYNSIIHQTFKIWWGYAKLSPKYEELWKNACTELQTYNSKIDGLMKICEERFRNQDITYTDALIELNKPSQAMAVCNSILRKNSQVYSRMYVLISVFNQTIPGNMHIDDIKKKAEGNYLAKIGKTTSIPPETSLSLMAIALEKNVNWIADDFFAKLKSINKPELNDKYSELIKKYADKQKDAKSLLATIRNTTATDREMIEVIRPGVEKNNSGALRRLARAYRDGRGVEKDLEKYIQ